MRNNKKLVAELKPIVMDFKTVKEIFIFYCGRKSNSLLELISMKNEK